MNRQCRFSQAASWYIVIGNYLVRSENKVIVGTY